MDVSGTLEKLSTDLSASEKEVLTKELSTYLNHLLLTDFPALVQLLYRVDVSEKKLKTVLAENPGADAGDLLAELLIQRQQEKAVARQAQRPTDAAPDEEAW